MTSYFLRRLLLIIPTFIGITLVVFVIMHFVPGGPVERQIMRYRMATMEGGGGEAGSMTVQLPESAIEEIRRYYGFDKPVHIRYIEWLWNVLQLDLGNSYIYQEPVWDVIKSRFPVSIFLGLTGFLLSYLVCVPLGVLKAVKHGSPIRLRHEHSRVSRVFGPRLGAGHRAARAVRRRQLLERVSARRIPPRQLGVPEPGAEDHRSRSGTCCCRCSATWSARSRR